MDTRDTRVHNLLFLLSTAPLAVGCVITGGDDTDTAAETTPNPTDDTTAGTETPATDTGPSVTDDGVTDDTTTMTPADETTATAGDETTATAGDETATTGGVEVPPACAAYGDAITLCYNERDGASAAQACAEEIAVFEMYYGAECVTAYEEWLACLSALSCEDLMMDTACPAETMTLETTCAKKGGK